LLALIYQYEDVNLVWIWRKSRVELGQWFVIHKG